MKLFHSLLILSIYVFLINLSPSVANAAEIVLSPSVGSHATGDSFAIEIQVDPKGVDVNAAVAELSFDNTILSVISISKVGSDFSLWTTEPTFSNVNGTINFGTGTPLPFSSISTVVTVTFEAQSGGTANVNVSSATILAADGLGTDIYSGSVDGVYEISGTPAVPVIEPVTQTVNLASGWNIVSTPKVLDSHTFSVSETSENFDIYILDASNPTGWSTMADLGQTEFTPLYGYFINNKTNSEQTLTFTYDTTLEPNEKLFQRTFSTSGWYSIGVANDEYAKDQNADRDDTNNPSRILSLLENKYDLVIDFTDAQYDLYRRSVAVTDPWKASIQADIDELNDFRETKGYAVYIKENNALYTGFQNDPVSEPIVAELSVETSLNNPDATTLKLDGSDKSDEYTVFAFNLNTGNSTEDITVSRIEITGSGTTDITNYIDDATLVANGMVISQDVTVTANSIVFEFADGDFVIERGEQVEAELSIVFNALSPDQEGDFVEFWLMSRNVDAEADGALEATGSAYGEEHTLRSVLPPEITDTSFTVDRNEAGDAGTISFEFTIGADNGDDFDFNVANKNLVDGSTDDIRFTTTGTDAGIDVATIALVSGDATADASGWVIADGDEATFVMDVTFATADASDGGSYRVTVETVGGFEIDETSPALNLTR